MENLNHEKKVLKFVKISEKACLPRRGTSGSAGMDLCACIDKEIILNHGEITKIPCGIAVNLPSEEYAAFIFARSGLGVKHGITLANGVGVIDSDYRGEICVGLCNIGPEPYTIMPDERIAQIIIMKVENLPLFEVDILDPSERDTGGFGSTGRK